MKKFLAWLLIVGFAFSASIATVGCSGDTKKDKDKDGKKADKDKADKADK